MESNTFPKATFKGTMTGVGADELKVAGTYVVQVSGELTIHGVKKPVKTAGAITVTADGKLKANSEFIVKPEDHGIKIPGVVRNNIAETITVKVLVDYDKL